MVEMSQFANSVYTNIFARYMKIVQFLEEKEMIQDYGIWYVEHFEAGQNKEQN